MWPHLDLYVFQNLFFQLNNLDYFLKKIKTVITIYDDGGDGSSNGSSNDDDDDDDFKNRNFN